MDDEDPESSDELTKRVLEGDRAALEELLLRNYEWLENYIKKMIPAHKRGLVNPEDVIQEVYFKLFRSVNNFEPQGRAQLFSWLKTIARSTLFDAFRREKQRANDTTAEMQRVMEQLVLDDNPRASQFVQVAELHRAFRLALGSLPEDYRKVIEMLYLEQQDMETVASELGRTPDAIRGLRTRARNALRESLVRLSNYV